MQRSSADATQLFEVHELNFHISIQIMRYLIFSELYCRRFGGLQNCVIVENAVKIRKKKMCHKYESFLK